MALTVKKSTNEDTWLRHFTKLDNTLNSQFMQTKKKNKQIFVRYIGLPLGGSMSSCIFLLALFFGIQSLVKT